MTKDRHRSYSVARRHRAVALAAKLGAAAAARQLGIHVSTLYTWQTRSGKTLAANGLPTKPATSTKARALVPTTYKCPHCDAQGGVHDYYAATGRKFDEGALYNMVERGLRLTLTVGKDEQLTALPKAG